MGSWEQQRFGPAEQRSFPSHPLSNRKAECQHPVCFQLFLHSPIVSGGKGMGLRAHTHIQAETGTPTLTVL